MSLRVVDPGPLTTVQDEGRPGWAHLGVPRAGFLDRPAARLANRLVGNASGAALLETTAGGVRLELLSAHTVAVTGARCQVRCQLRAAGRTLSLDEAVSLPAGTELVVGPASQGLRSYVAVAGGVDVEPVLGSRSTDTLAGIGPPVLTAGAVLRTGPLPRCPVWVPTTRRRPLTEPAVVRVLPGPQTHWLGEPAGVDGARGRVGIASNRVGLRLAGLDLPRRRGEMSSEGMVVGAVQLPSSGEAVVFLNDHPTTGGYPVVAVVHPDDLPVCAQARPGDEIVLTWA